MKKRLRRLPIYYTRNPIFFITLCAKERKCIFASDTIHKAFLDFISKSDKRNAYVGRYVLMPDHIHLFISLGETAITLSNWVVALKNFIGKELKDQGEQPPFWQGGFFDHVLRGSESYENKWLYVRENPVRAQLVKQFHDWPYQGEKFYLEYKDD